MKGNIIYTKTIPGKDPEYAPFPENLHPDIISFLDRQHIQTLYTHQAETFQHAMERRNVVITMPTASGKSLCFYLPVISVVADLMEKRERNPTPVWFGQMLAAEKPQSLLKRSDFFRNRKEFPFRTYRFWHGFFRYYVF